MNEPMSRPTNLPSDARYAELEGWFEVGERKDGRRFGPYRAFRKDDGTLLFEARFDELGRLQGAFKRFHRDGSIARGGMFNQGAAVGQWTYRRGADDVFPVADERVREAIVTFDKQSRSWTLLDAKGREVVPGEPIDERSGWADVFFGAATPDDFLSSYAWKRLIAETPAAAPVADTDDGFFFPFSPAPRERFSEAGYRNRFGDVAPSELVRWFASFAESTPDFDGIVPVRDVLAGTSEGMFEAIVREHQASPGRATALRELCSCIVPIARGPRGIVFGHCTLETGFDRPTNSVYRFDAAANDFDRVARTLDDFAALTAARECARSKALSRRGLDAFLAKLKGRSYEIAPFDDVHASIVAMEEDERGEEDRFLAPLYLLVRSAWIRELFVGNVEGAYAKFRPDIDGGLSDERFAGLRSRIPVEGMLGMYWLWRTYLLGDDRIREMLTWCADSPSALVREVAGIVAAMLAGTRKSLGDVEDLPALRAAFLAMNPTEKKSPTDEAEDEEEEDEEAEDDEEDEEDEGEDSDEEDDEDED